MLGVMAVLTVVERDLGVGRSEAWEVPLLAGYHGEQHHVPRGQEDHGLVDVSTLPGRETHASRCFSSTTSQVLLM